MLNQEFYMSPERLIRVGFDGPESMTGIINGKKVIYDACPMTFVINLRR